MSDDITILKARVDHHEAAIEQMESSTQRVLEKMDRLTDGLSSLTACFKEYSVRHEYVTKQNDEIKQIQQQHDSIIRKLENQQSANQPVIDGIRALNAKLIWFIIAAIVGPMLTVYTVIANGGQ